MAQLKRELPATGKSLKSGDGDGTFEGMESRVAKLESTTEHILRELMEVRLDIREMRKDARTDFRTLAAISIGGILGLAAIMAHGFQWIP